MEIKFRRKDLVKTMRRVDPVYMSLAERLGESPTSILITALYGFVLRPQPCPCLARSYISGGSMCAFAVVLHLMLIVSSSLHSLRRRVNHSLLRSISHSPVSPAQLIDFPPGSEQLGSKAVWALCFRRIG